ncbi:MAG: Phosphatidate cytidylyltransferase [Pseudomonadota bacterium]
MLKQRIITALILAPLMIGGIFFLPSQAFGYFIALIAVLGAWEWANMSGFSAQPARVAFAGVMAAILAAVAYALTQEACFTLAILAAGAAWWLMALLLVARYPNLTAFWSPKAVRLFIGLLVLVPMWVGFVVLKAQNHSALLIVYLMFVVWGADTGAYFAGKQFGKAKLAPQVSPGKSWAGFWGGLATTMLVAAVFVYYIEHNIQSLSTTAIGQLILITLLTALVSVLGDLLESMFKRYCGIKDSSALLPGHGGILDRIDSMTAAVPVFAFLLLVFNWSLA